jgi:hypothetical protein
MSKLRRQSAAALPRESRPKPQKRPTEGKHSPVRYWGQDCNSGTKRRHKGALPLVGESELSPVILV